MPSGSPDYAARGVSSASGDEQIQHSASDTSSTATFSQTCLSIVIYNDGPNPVHMARGGSVTTSNFKIPAKAWFMTDVPTKEVSFICATGETATIYMVGVF